MLQLKREIVDLGFAYSLLVFAFLIFIAIGGYVQLQLPFIVWHTSAAAVLLALIIQLKRTDKQFVFTIVIQPQFIFWLEYSFFSLPLFILFIITGNWLYVPLLTRIMQ